MARIVHRHRLPSLAPAPGLRSPARHRARLFLVLAGVVAAVELWPAVNAAWLGVTDVVGEFADGAADGIPQRGDRRPAGRRALGAPAGATGQPVAVEGCADRRGRPARALSGRVDAGRPVRVPARATSMPITPSQRDRPAPRVRDDARDLGAVRGPEGCRRAARERRDRGARRRGGRHRDRRVRAVGGRGDRGGSRSAARHQPRLGARERRCTCSRSRCSAARAVAGALRRLDPRIAWRLGAVAAVSLAIVPVVSIGLTLARLALADGSRPSSCSRPSGSACSSAGRCSPSRWAWGWARCHDGPMDSVPGASGSRVPPAPSSPRHQPSRRSRHRLAGQDLHGR